MDNKTIYVNKTGYPYNHTEIRETPGARVKPSKIKKRWMGVDGASRF